MIYHIVTAIHDSRTSQRMIDYKARQRRFFGIKPNAEVYLMTDEEEILIAKVVGELVDELQLKITAFNLCKDHMHMILVCKRDEVPKIMHRIKGRTARACNVYRAQTGVHIKGINPLDGTTPLHALPPSLLKDRSTPFWTQKYGCKPITTSKQYRNTVRYIRNNKQKHQLPANVKLERIIDSFKSSFQL